MHYLFESPTLEIEPFNHYNWTTYKKMSMSHSYTAQAALVPGRSLPSSRDDDLDSTLGDDDSSGAEYCSATESIYDFRVENGRTYHAYMDGKYLFPNDEVFLH